jgi:hypothetical protein
MTCAGCDATLPPNRGPGRARKWCSEKCRKVTLYSSRCLDCGAVCNTDGRVAGAAVRCSACARDRARDMDRRRNVSEKTNGKSWSDGEILAALRATAVDGVVTVPMYEAQRNGWRPSVPTIVNRFGSWSAAAAAAGLDVSRHYRAPRCDRTPDEVLLRLIQEHARELGRAPSYEEHQAWTLGRGPSAQTARIRFGSWMNALDAALPQAAA